MKIRPGFVELLSRERRIKRSLGFRQLASIMVKCGTLLLGGEPCHVNDLWTQGRKEGTLL